MRNRIIAIIGVLLLLDFHYVNGQLSVTMGFRQSSMIVNTEIPIFVIDPSVSGFSTAAFSKQYPGSSIISENLYVNFPNMSGAIDTVAILWYLKPENYSQKGEVNIVLIGIAPDSSKIFYIDNNNDRTFSDNEDSFVFKPEIEKRILEIKILGASYNYTLFNPDYSASIKSPSRTKEYYSVWHQSIKKPSLTADFSLVIGGGYTSLRFEPVTGAVDMYNYFGKISGSVRPSIGLDFSWYNIHVLFSGSFERIQYDETARFGYVDNIIKPQREYNSDPWMEMKLHAGITAEYDLGLFRSVWLTPFGTCSVYKNTDNKIFDKRFPRSGAEYKDLYSTEYGVKLKLPTAYRTLLYIKASYIKSYFDASEFLPQYVPGSYSLNYHQTYFGVGFQYRLFR